MPQAWSTGTNGSRSPQVTSDGASIERRSRGERSGWAATSAAIAGSSRRHAPTPWPASWRRPRSAANGWSSRSIRSGSISRRATLSRGSRWVVIPTITSVLTRAGARTVNCNAVIAPIEKPRRWNVARPSASANAARSSTSQS